MTLASLVFFSVLSKPSQGPVDLGRVFVKGEKLEYSVKATLNEEQRQLGLETWLPDVVDFNYDFTLFAEEMKTDGITVVRYQRPLFTQVIDDEKKIVDKVNLDLRITLSPYNELLEQVDLTKKPKTPDKKGGKKGGGLMWRGTNSAASKKQLMGLVSNITSELQRLSVFLGSLDTSLDLNPRTPFEEVKVGETWKRTFGYSPQKLKGKKDKEEMQRIDYTYVYKGPMTSEGKEILRVEASTDVKGDLAAFINSMFEISSKETGLSKIPLTFKGVIEFDLDPKTKHTLSARAKSQSSFGIWLTDEPTRAVMETRSKGSSVMTLNKRTVPAKK